jgi:Ca-activated chloride channel family protein
MNAFADFPYVLKNCPFVSRRFLRQLAIPLIMLAALTACNSRPKEEEHIPLAPRVANLLVVYSPELRQYFNAAKEQFASNKPQLSDGTSITISGIEEPAVSAAKKIASGEIKADAWLSASSSLVNYTNSHIRNLGARQTQCTQLFSTPVVLAVGSSQAEQFPAQQQKVSWATLSDHKLAGAPGIDDAQAIVYAHATPESASGFASLLQLAFLSGPTHEKTLSVDSFNLPRTQEKFARYQAHISQYATRDSALLERVALSGSKRIRFVLTTEQQVAAYNYRNQDNGALAITALYPEEGSVWQDYSFCASDADWVNPPKRAALSIFSQYLSSDLAQLEAKKSGFRPNRTVLPDVPPLQPKFGVNTGLPDSSLLPVSGDVVAEVLQAWQKLVRPSATMLILDNSGSMEGDPLTASREALRVFMANRAPYEKLGLVSVSTQPEILAALGTQIPEIGNKLDGISAQGGSALYDGLRVAIDALTDISLSGSRKNIVLVTDGADKSSELSVQGILNYVNEKLVRHDMQILIVHLDSAAADSTDLKRVAKAANGVFRDASPYNVETVLIDAFKSMSE